MATVVNPVETRFSCQGCALWPAAVLLRRAFTHHSRIQGSYYSSIRPSLWRCFRDAVVYCSMAMVTAMNGNNVLDNVLGAEKRRMLRHSQPRQPNPIYRSRAFLWSKQTYPFGNNANNYIIEWRFAMKIPGSEMCVGCTRSVTSYEISRMAHPWRQLAAALRKELKLLRSYRDGFRKEMER